MLVYLTMKKAQICDKIRSFGKDESGMEVVQVLLVLVIAVAAAWLFREKIIELINNLFGQMNITGLGAKQ